MLIDYINEDGKLYFRAETMPDLEVFLEDLIMTDENKVTCQLLDTDIKCVAVGKRYDEWFSKYLDRKLIFFVLICFIFK